MKLLTVMITHNRLAYTKQTLENYLSTVTVPQFLVVVDNASTDDTKEWLEMQSSKGKINYLLLNDKNYYPGAAANFGWAKGLEFYPEATHLMRLDNDMAFADGWSEVAKKYFDKIPKLGQLGLDYGPMNDPEADRFDEYENGMTYNPYPGNIGGTMIMRKEIWAQGIKYDTTPWSYSKEIPTAQEDVKLSADIFAAKWKFGHSTVKLAWTIDNWEDYPEYYIKTMTDRGYGKVFKRRLDKLRKLADDKRISANS